MGSSVAAETHRLQPRLWKGRDICKSVTLILLKGLMGILESRAIYTLASGKHSLSTADTTKVEEILNAPPTDCDVCSSEVYHSQI